MYEPRWYRRLMEGERFVSFTVNYLETDLWIGINTSSYRVDIVNFTLKKVKYLRSILDEYIACHASFLTTLTPIKDDLSANIVIRSMIAASSVAGTGPMSAVAGAFAQFVGEAIIKEFGVKEIIVENGGDIYLAVQNDLEVGVFAGNSPLSNKLAVIIPASCSPLGICTSSGTVGHSLSFGNTDATMIACNNTALADALATRFGNEVKTVEDFQKAFILSEKFSDIQSIIIIIGDKLGIKGKFQVKPLV